MEAVLSGSAGIAIAIKGSVAFGLQAHAENKLPEVPVSKLMALFHERADLQLLEDVDEDSIQKALDAAVDAEDALHLVLIALDKELSRPTRLEAVRVLEVELERGEVTSRLNRIMYARPLPGETDVESAILIADDANAPAVSHFLQALISAQNHIEEVCKAWNAIPIETFESTENRSAFECLAVQHGLFFSLTHATSPSHVEEFLVNSLLCSEISNLPSARKILLTWADPFRGEGTGFDATHDIEDEELFPEYGKGRKARSPFATAGALAIYRERVDLQKNSIKEELRRHNVGKARTFIEDLIGDQLAHDSAPFLAKSLCDIAVEAKSSGYDDLAVDLTRRSTELAPNDGRAWAQYGAALISVDAFDEAIEAFREAASLKSDARDKTYLAQIERHQGRLEDALETYEAVIREFPDDIVPKLGRAAVLKKLNRFPETLRAYEEVLDAHPDSIVAQAGRADTLKALNRLDESLAAYNTIISQYPDNVVAKCGRADVLKCLDRLHDSLRTYESIIEEHPSDSVAKCARADILKRLNRNKDSLVAYESILRSHPEDLVARHGRAEALKALGRLGEALTAYDTIISETPTNLVAQTGRAGILRSMNRLNEALSCYEQVLKRNPFHFRAKAGRASVLIILGRYKEVISEMPEKRPVSADEWDFVPYSRHGPNA